MSVRLPSAADHELQVEKEHQWLPLPIPAPLVMGKPEYGYPWKWSIYRWLDGKAATSAKIGDLAEFAIDLAGFLIALHRIDATDGPPSGLHSFFRGGSLSVYEIWNTPIDIYRVFPVLIFLFPRGW